jgi:hypothetical protein
VTTRRRRAQTDSPPLTAPRAELPVWIGALRGTIARRSGARPPMSLPVQWNCWPQRACTRLTGQPRPCWLLASPDAPVVPAGVVTSGAAQITKQSRARCSPVSEYGRV